jgi:MEMO1 family protein
MGAAISNDCFGQEVVRRAAVAGTFYENNPALLREVVLRYLADAKPLSEPVRYLISPHAGFVFSGPVAAKGFATLDPAVRRVFLIGPSHHKAFQGIAVPRFTQYETPLGRVRVDREVVEKLRTRPGVIVAEGFDEPEHSLEVQLPFLQVTLSNFTIVPVITGHVDPKKAAELIAPFIDATTAVIASSDLSHFEPQRRARAIDDASIATIMAGDITGPIDGCGALPIRVIMALANRQKLVPVTLDARTSFETAPQHGSENRVVGYASIVYVTQKTAEKHSAAPAIKTPNAAGEAMTADKQALLLSMARGSLEAAVRNTPYTPLKNLPSDFLEMRGCFVTLKKGGVLRGCIGYIEPIKPLYQAVIENARNAALSDPRFPPVNSSELSAIKIELSLLTPPAPLRFRSPDDLLQKLAPGCDGVILRKGNQQSTYLPQVWEQLPDKVVFLEQLAIKAGMPRDGWKSAEVLTYQALHFEE